MPEITIDINKGEESWSVSRNFLIEDGMIKPKKGYRVNVRHFRLGVVEDKGLDNKKEVQNWLNDKMKKMSKRIIKVV